MKILFITPHVPHAGVVGGHQLVYQRMRRLSERGHTIGLAAFDSGEDAETRARLQTELDEVRLIDPPRRHSVPGQLARFAFSSIPPYFWEYRSDVMMKAVGDMVHEGGYEAVIAEFSAMGQYLFQNPYLPAVLKFISCHFSLGTSYRSFARTMGLSRIGIRSRLAADRMADYESAMFRQADRVLVLTSHERYALQNADPNLQVDVIPCGVDVGYFHPDQTLEKEPAIMFTGQYETLPNLDAVAWFVDRIWPELKKRHPQLRFYVIGPGSEAMLKHIAKKDASIVVTGRVDDIRPYLHRSKVFVCPVRLGSGFHFKNLEAMAAGTPVVTTQLGAEGMPMQNGDNCFIADQPEKMVMAISLLLADDELRAEIAYNARKLVERKFEWNRSIDMLEDSLLVSSAQGAVGCGA